MNSLSLNPSTLALSGIGSSTALNISKDTPSNFVLNSPFSDYDSRTGMRKDSRKELFEPRDGNFEDILNNLGVKVDKDNSMDPNEDFSLVPVESKEIIISPVEDVEENDSHYEVSSDDKSQEVNFLLKSMTNLLSSMITSVANIIGKSDHQRDSHDYKLISAVGVADLGDQRDENNNCNEEDERNSKLETKKEDVPPSSITDSPFFKKIKKIHEKRLKTLKKLSKNKEIS